MFLCCYDGIEKLEDVSDALSSMQISSSGIPDELCIEGTEWHTVSVCQSIT